jgi:G3E family GTPase
MASDIPVFIVTGFLGAGKTTLLNRLLADPAMSDSAVVINEFGEIGLDHLIVATPSENTVLLQNGCLCCTVQGELTTTLIDLYKRRADESFPRFNRVLVETTGLADPMPILQSLLGDDDISRCYRLGSVIAIVDAVNAPGQLDAAFEVVKQVAAADRIILSKGDLVTENMLASLAARIAGINPHAAIMRVCHGGANVGDVLTEGSATRTRAANAGSETPAQHISEGASGFRHGEVTTFSLEWPAAATEAGLHAWLHMLASFKGPDLLRVKGIVNVQGQPVVINAVQALIHEPMHLPQWPSANRHSRVVFITRGIDRHALEATLDALDYKHVRGAGLDRERYAEFVRLAQRFRAAPLTNSHAFTSNEDPERS